MNIDRVTITGADDTTPVSELLRVSDAYPFVEWGILMSSSNEGGPRFPSKPWLRMFRDQKTPFINSAVHVCGKWTRDMLAGKSSFREEMGEFWPSYNRLQWNFHAERVRVIDQSLMAEELVKFGKVKIFQMDGVNDTLRMNMWTLGVAVFPLFDESGGQGIVPTEWPIPIPNISNGYAGGLGPNNLLVELARIEKKVGYGRIWIDMETKIRTDSGRALDFHKIKKCLEIVKEFRLERKEEDAFNA